MITYHPDLIQGTAAMARTAPPATDATDDGWPGPGGDA